MRSLTAGVYRHSARIESWVGCRRTFAKTHIFGALNIHMFNSARRRKAQSLRLHWRGVGTWLAEVAN